MPLGGTRNSLSSSDSSVLQLEREVQDAQERLERKLRAKGRKGKPPLSTPEQETNHLPTTEISRPTTVVQSSIRTSPYFSYLDLGRIETWATAANEAAKRVRGIQPVIRGMQWIGQRWPKRLGPLAGLIFLYINSVAALIFHAGITGLEVPATMVCGVPLMWKGHWDFCPTPTHVEDPIYSDIGRALTHLSNATEQSTGLMALSHNVQVSQLWIDHLRDRAERSRSIAAPQIISECTEYEKLSNRVEFSMNGHQAEMRALIKEALSYIKHAVKSLKRVEKDHNNQARAVIDMKAFLGIHKFEKRKRTFRVYRSLIENLLVMTGYALSTINELNTDVYKLHEALHKIKTMLSTEKDSFLRNSRDHWISWSKIINWTRAQVDETELLQRDQRFFQDLGRATEAELKELQNALYRLRRRLRHVPGTHNENEEDKIQEAIKHLQNSSEIIGSLLRTRR